MGLFDKKGTCAICGAKQGKAVSDGFVCSDCWTKAGMFAMPLNSNKHLAMVAQVRERIMLNQQWIQSQNERGRIYRPTFIVGDHLMVDEANRLWTMCTGTLKKKPIGFIYSFNDIIEYELDEDGETVTKGGLGRAAVGGLLLGGVGAVVGGVTGGKRTSGVCTKMDIVFSFKNQYMKIPMHLIPAQVKKRSMLYDAAQKNANFILEYLDKATAVPKVQDIPANSVNSVDSVNAQKTENKLSIADELKKYAALKEEGSISEAEYEEIKSKLLMKV